MSLESSRTQKYSFGLLNLIMRLNRTMSHQQVADYLNDKNIKPAKAKQFTKYIVGNMINGFNRETIYRKANHIPKKAYAFETLLKVVV